MKELYRSLLKDISDRKVSVNNEMDEVSRLLNIYELSETYKELEDLPKVMELEGKPFLDNLKTELDETAASLDKCYVKIAELLEV